MNTSPLFLSRQPDVPIHARILVIDDDLASLHILERLLKRAGYAHIAVTSNPLEAEDAYASFQPDLILLDLHMPRLGGFALLAQLRARIGDDLVPVLVLTGDPSAESVKKALSSGARDFLGKPFEAVELVLRVDNLLVARFAQLALRESNEHLEAKVTERTKELANAEIATLQLLARTAEFRDDETGRHTHRVGAMAARLAAAVELAPADIELIRVAAPLHDIGKIGIPDRILLKPGQLSDEERAAMQTHAAIGAEILSTLNFPVLRAARDIALSHHERWDGTGYPEQRRGTETPLLARIVAVADVFDALRHDRPYRPGLDRDVVVELIERERERHFDPEIVDAFSALARKGELESDQTT
jgi:putative two-component system response regulator